MRDEEKERMIATLKTLASGLAQFAQPGGPRPTKDELWSLLSCAMYGLGDHAGIGIPKGNSANGG